MTRTGVVGKVFQPSACFLALLLVALSYPDGSAAATTFGANLNRPADNTTTCFDYWYPFLNSSSCTFESQNPSTGESGFPPAGRGLVTKVRVKVGPTTGPMQIVVEQALRKDNPSDPGHPTYACCKAVQLSQVFTPAPNAITEVPVNLSVRQDISPDPATGNYVDQHLALSVLAPNVPIPAASDPGASFGAWTPAWTLGQERVDTYAGVGATILFNADWVACPTGRGAGGAGPGAVIAKKKRKKKRKSSPCAPASKKKKKKTKKRKRG